MHLSRQQKTTSQPVFQVLKEQACRLLLLLEKRPKMWMNGHLGGIVAQLNVQGQRLLSRGAPLKTYFMRALIVLGIVIAVDIIGSVLFLDHVRQHVSNENTSQMEAGFVFFGGANQTFNHMNAESLRRTDFTFRLFQAGQISKVVCLGGAYPSRNYSGAEDMKKYLMQKGVPADKIFVEHNSYDSKSNWLEGCAILRQNQWHQVVLIASPLHIFRLKKIIQTQNCPAEIRFAAYDYATQNPRIAFWQLWKQIHYEWTAFLAEFLLPDKFYQNILKKMRQ